MAFISTPDGDLKNVFLTDAWLLDQFVGNALWAWGGNNAAGSLGDNTIVGKSSPVQTVTGGTNWKQVTQSAAIKTDNTLWVWGNNGSGRLGDNTIVSKSSPIQTISGGTDWKQVVSANTGAYTFAIKTDGTLWTWGLNGSGQLGDNTITHRSSPVQTVSGGTNWKQISICTANNGFAGAIKTDGTLWMWGNNANGNLGNNSTTATGGNISSPVQTVTGGTTWYQVSCGVNHTAGIKTDGTLWVWGSNLLGQLGDNTVTHRSSPVQTLSGGTNWKQVSCGNSFTFAIKTDGTLWGWGAGGTGVLGDNTTVGKSSPVQTISGGNNWKQVSASPSQNACAAIKTDGTLWLWGQNAGPFAGILGDNTVVNKSSPVQTVMGGSTWKQVALGNTSCFAITNG